MKLIQELSVNMLFLLLPILIYQLFEIKIKNSRLFIAAAAGISLILCMSFPITTIREGHIFDLRQIPLIMSGIYGGYLPLLSTFSALIGYRFYLGGEGAVGALYVNLILTVILVAAIPIIKGTESMMKRVAMVTGLALIGSLLTVIIYSLFTTEPIIGFTDLLVSLFLIQMLGILMLAMIIETIKANRTIHEQLIRTEKIHSVGELTASMAHEVRNPLTVVRGFIQLFAHDNVSLDKRKMYSNLILQELDRAESILTDYLQFSRPSLENIKPLHVSSEMNSIFNMMEPFAINKGVELVQKFSADEGIYFEGDSGVFRQSMVNIIKNAIEATPPKGKVTIALSQSESDVIVEIKDTGIGMNREQLRRLGEPFFSTKEKGTGLGLMVTFSSIQRMKGEINIASHVGKGTSFFITFPRLSK